MEKIKKVVWGTKISSEFCRCWTLAWCLTWGATAERRTSLRRVEGFQSLIYFARVKTEERFLALVLGVPLVPACADVLVSESALGCRKCHWNISHVFTWRMFPHQPEGVGFVPADLEVLVTQARKQNALPNHMSGRLWALDWLESLESEREKCFWRAVRAALCGSGITQRSGSDWHFMDGYRSHPACLESWEGASFTICYESINTPLNRWILLFFVLKPAEKLRPWSLNLLFHVSNRCQL